MSGWGPEATDTTAVLVVDDNDDNRYTLIHRLDRRR
jgi:CheY-like chemotaxis protein